MQVLQSSWIDFLRLYGPISSNDNMYDEAIQRVVRKKHIDPILIEGKYIQELVDNFRSDNPRSVILTGTAGDGKTYHCRQVWECLGGTTEKWEDPSKIKCLSLGRIEVKVVKDLSELRDDDRALLKEVAEKVFTRNPDTVFLLAANDGQLTEAWRQVNDDPCARAVGEAVENMLVNGDRDNREFHLRMYNLSKIEAQWAFPKIVENLLQHPGWNSCRECLLRDNVNLAERCPIWENRKRLEGTDNQNILMERVIELLQLSEINGQHLPIRQLLALVTNMILGHPEAKDRLMTCKEVPKILRNGTASDASIYRNVFGKNLTRRKRQSMEIFATLGRFGIGDESSNLIDNMLIFGADDPDFQPMYQEFVLSDPYYGADQSYIADQKSYLEGDAPSEKHNFLAKVSSQRQRLFFTIPQNQAHELKLWELTMFQYAGQFLNEVYRPLISDGQALPQIHFKLVRGLNRIFTGFLTKSHDELVLATSGSDSQAKISRIFEDAISVRPKRGESVELSKNDNGIVLLSINLSLSQNIPPVVLELNLIRFEFLSRVSDGALPGSFSRECYEDILAFKSRLLRQLDRRRIEEHESEVVEGSIALKVLSLMDNGNFTQHNVEVLY